MEIVTSVSGGQTSAYLAANYPSDHLVFALVRTENQKAKYPDKKLRQLVEDRIQKPFISTQEDDVIIHTILDLEQFLGREINWVSGPTFEWVINNKGKWLPSKLHRYCTTSLKIEPIFEWWLENVGEPVITHLGFRKGEEGRATRSLEKCNDDGFLVMHWPTGYWDHGPNKGKKKWEYIPWSKPEFPLIENGIKKDNIVKYWVGKPVRFARLNNCVHCFHRSPLLLRKLADEHPEKLQWAADQESPEKNYWRSDTSYEKIINHPLQHELSFDDFSDCDSGFCGL